MRDNIGGIPIRDVPFYGRQSIMRGPKVDETAKPEIDYYARHPDRKITPVFKGCQLILDPKVQQ